MSENWLDSGVAARIDEEASRNPYSRGLDLFPLDGPTPACRTGVLSLHCVRDRARAARPSSWEIPRELLRVLRGAELYVFQRGPAGERGWKDALQEDPFSWRGVRKSNRPSRSRPSWYCKLRDAARLRKPIDLPLFPACGCVWPRLTWAFWMR